MNCLSANACGRRLSLHFHCTTGLDFVPQPYVPFRSSSAPASATHARVFLSFHCAQANPSFYSAPLWPFFPTIQITQPKRETSFHPPQFSTLHSVTTLAFPNPISGMPCEVFTPANQKPQKPHRPLMVQVKIKDHSRIAFVLAAGSSHSFNRSLGRSYLATQFTNSFRSPYQLQHRTCKCFVPQHPRFPPPTTTAFPLIFTSELFAP